MRSFAANLDITEFAAAARQKRLFARVGIGGSVVGEFCERGEFIARGGVVENNAVTIGVRVTAEIPQVFKNETIRRTFVRREIFHHPRIGDEDAFARKALFHQAQKFSAHELGGDVRLIKSIEHNHVEFRRIFGKKAAAVGGMHMHAVIEIEVLAREFDDALVRLDDLDCKIGEMAQQKFTEHTAAEADHECAAAALRDITRPGKRGDGDRAYV